MPKNPSSKASLGDVAKAAGVSKATASMVLRNCVGPSEKTRAMVFKVAKDLAYAPDPRIGALMSRVHNAGTKDLVPLAWLDNNWEKGAWETYKFLTPYLEGARARAQELGYRIDTIWAREPGMSMRRISKIIYQRGIEGVIVTPGVKHVRLEWEKLASVALGSSLLAPALHRVMADVTFNLLLTLKMLKRHGYVRIGICMDRLVGRGSYDAVLAASHYFHATLPKEEIIPILIYARGRGTTANDNQQSIARWLKEQKPDVVVGHDNALVKTVTASGFRVPEQVGVVHIATDDDVKDWAGIDSKRRETGAFAAEWVISLVQNRRFGVPGTAITTMIRGAWHNGRTLLVPKPK